MSSQPPEAGGTAGAEGTNMRGQLAIASRKAIKGMLGNLDLAQNISHLSPAAQLLVGERLVATQWYGLEGVPEAMAYWAGLARMDPEDFATEVGHEVVRCSTGRVGQTLLRLLASPERLAKYVVNVWPRLFDSGRMEGNKLIAEISGWRGHQLLLCRTSMGCFGETARQVHLPKKIRTRRLGCIGNGDPRCRMEIEFLDDLAHHPCA